MAKALPSVAPLICMQTDWTTAAGISAAPFGRLALVL
jgi:hypothetical protein